MTRALAVPVELDLILPSAEPAPGETVEAVVVLVAENDTTTLGGQIELVVHQEVEHRERTWGGAGYRLAEGHPLVVGRVPLAPSNLAAGRAVEQRIRLRVPSAGPPTVEGRLVRITWTVRARVRREDGLVEEGSRPLRVRSGSGGAASSAPGVRADDASRARVALAPRTRLLAPGRPLSGEATVSPLRPGRARAVRVELVLAERVTADGPQREEGVAETVVARQVLVEGVGLDPAHPLSMAYHLAVPESLPAPTLVTAGFSVRWLLRLVVDLPMHADPWSEVELVGGTAAS